MDTEVLVESRLVDGQKVLDELRLDNFDISVAFWVYTSEDHLWVLYIGSASVEPAKIGDAYRRLYTCMSRIPDLWVSMSEIKLVEPTNPIAKDAIAVRNRHPVGLLPVRYQGNMLGNLAIEAAFIYPDFKIARIREFTGIIRKAIEAKYWKEHQQIPPEAETAQQTVEAFARIVRPIQGNRKEVDLNNPQDSYLIFEATIRWCADYLSGSPCQA